MHFAVVSALFELLFMTLTVWLGELSACVVCIHECIFTEILVFMRCLALSNLHCCQFFVLHYF